MRYTSNWLNGHSIRPRQVPYHEPTSVIRWFMIGQHEEIVILGVIYGSLVWWVCNPAAPVGPRGIPGVRADRALVLGVWARDAPRPTTATHRTHAANHCHTQNTRSQPLPHTEHTQPTTATHRTQGGVLVMYTYTGSKVWCV